MSDADNMTEDTAAPPVLLPAAPFLKQLRVDNGDVCRAEEGPAKPAADACVSQRLCRTGRPQEARSARRFGRTCDRQPPCGGPDADLGIPASPRGGQRPRSA